MFEGLLSVTEVDMKSFGEEYFEGYIEETIPKNNGKGVKKVRVYIGDVYKLDASNQARIKKKLLFAALAVIFAVSIIVAGTQGVEANKKFFVTFPYAVGLIFGYYSVLGVINYLVTKQDMTVFQYNEFRKKILFGTNITMYAMFVTVLSNFLYLVISLLQNKHSIQQITSKDLFVLGLNVISCLSIFILRKTEINSKYICIPGKKGAVNNGNDVEGDDLTPVVGLKALEDDENESSFFLHNKFKW